MLLAEENTKNGSQNSWFPGLDSKGAPLEHKSSVTGYSAREFWIKLYGRLRLKCDGTRAETRFRLSAKRTSPFKSAGASVQSTTGSRGVRISGSNAGYTMFRGSVKSTGYPLHSPVSPSLPLPCVTMCRHISTGLYNLTLCDVQTWKQGLNRLFCPKVLRNHIT